MGKTALHTAAANGKEEICHQLVAAGAYLDVQDKVGFQTKVTTCTLLASLAVCKMIERNLQAILHQSINN